MGASCVPYEFVVRNLHAACTAGAASGRRGRPPPLEELPGLPILRRYQHFAIDAHTSGKPDFSAPNSPNSREAWTTTLKLVIANLWRPSFYMDGV